MSTLDLSKARQAYTFLFGDDLSESQIDHLTKLCAIYQVKPDNLDIIRDIVNSGYIKQTENVLAIINNIIKKADTVSVSIAETGGEIQNRIAEEKSQLIAAAQQLEKQFEKNAAALAQKQENIMLQKFDAIVENQMKEATTKYLSKFVRESVEEASNIFGQKSGKIWNAIWVSALATSGFWLVAIYYILKTRG